MDNQEIQKLQSINDFPELVEYLRDELDWPIETDDFDDLTFEYTAEELGIDEDNAAKILEIKRLRPLDVDQPWGIFFVRLEPKRLPVVALRRLLSKVAIKKRASANKADQVAWNADDILFISSFGDHHERQLSFAYFAVNKEKHDLPILKVLGWDNKDTRLHIDAVVETLKEKLLWPEDVSDTESWRQQWREAFTLRHKEVVSTSKEMAIRLAELAQNIRDSIIAVLQVESDNGPLRQIMKTFRDALIHDLTEEGFADMYAQTIAYGLLSARISDPQGSHTVDHLGDHMRTNPFLRELMETFLDVGGRKRGEQRGAGLDFDELGVSEVVDLLDSANMEAVVRDFGDRNPQEDPVIHFYESFLKEYDAQKRVQRGVYYTPLPVVSYIVCSVHELLQNEFDLADGLADTTTWGEMLEKKPGLKLPPLTDEPGEKHTISPDEPFVQILDPATGTATFLVEVIEVIQQTLLAKWTKQGLNRNQQDAAWNDYVPQHLLPRLHAFELMMAPYAIAHMKIGLKLAETGYHFHTEERARIYLTNALEPKVKQLPLIGFDALAHEAAAVNEIKWYKRFTVVIGNPPYAGHSSNKGPWIKELLRDYYKVDGVPLDEKNTKWLQDDYVKFIRLSQQLLHVSKYGILGLITNHGFMENPTFRGMRKSLIDEFGDLRLLDLHGNSKKKERSPDGNVDENVFDIQQGVSIILGITGMCQNILYHADLYGTREVKYNALQANSVCRTVWNNLEEIAPYFLFKTQEGDLSAEYSTYMAVNELMPIHSLGVVTARDALCIHFTKAEAWKTVEDFSAMNPELAREHYTLGSDARDWQVAMAQADLNRNGLQRKRLRRILYRPFDWRWTYYTGNSRGFHCMPRGEVMRHMIDSPNLGLSTNRNIEVGEFTHVACSNTIIGHHCVSLKEVNYLFPLWLSPREDDFEIERHPNLAPTVLSRFGKNTAPEEILHYAYAVFHSPGYRSRYAELLKMDFPRLPLTENLKLFSALTELGDRLTALHLLKSPIMNNPTSEFTGDNHQVTKVGWTSDNGGTVWLDGTGTAKVFNTGTSGFRPVPEEVWNFRIGGYQVCEKWLKDRGPKKGNSGRILTDQDIAHYHKIVIALTETIRIMGEIDKVIETHGGWPDAFVTG